MCPLTGHNPAGSLQASETEGVDETNSLSVPEPLNSGCADEGMRLILMAIPVTEFFQVGLDMGYRRHHRFSIVNHEDQDKVKDSEENSGENKGKKQGPTRGKNYSPSNGPESQSHQPKSSKSQDL